MLMMSMDKIDTELLGHLDNLLVYLKTRYFWARSFKDVIGRTQTIMEQAGETVSAETAKAVQEALLNSFRKEFDNTVRAALTGYLKLLDNAPAERDLLKIEEA